MTDLIQVELQLVYSDSDINRMVRLTLRPVAEGRGTLRKILSGVYLANTSAIQSAESLLDMYELLRDAEHFITTELLHPDIMEKELHDE